MIALIVDEPDEVELLQSYFQRYAAETGEEFEINCFPDYPTYLRLFPDVYQSIHDLVVMDIDLPDKQMDTAERQQGTDHSVVLIFVTNMARCITEGKAADALDILLKPVSYSNFTVTIQRALQRCQSDRCSHLLIRIPKGMHRIPVSHIRYIEVRNHTLVFHTIDGDYVATGKLKDVKGELASWQFIPCNRCYLVNPAFVRTVEGRTLALDIGQLLISRPRRPAVLEALNNYWKGAFGEAQRLPALPPSSGK